MADLSLYAIGRAAKNAVIGAIKTTGDTAEAIVESSLDLLKVTVESVTEVTVAAEKGAAQIVTGAIGAEVDVGEDVATTIKSAVRGTIKGASEVGADVSDVALKATQGAIKAAGQVGVDTSEATKQAVTGAIEAAEEIGTDASKAVRDVLTTSVDGAKDVIKAPFK